MPSIWPNLPPIVIALTAQLVAFWLGFLIQQNLHFPVTLLEFGIACGFGAAALGYWARLPIWWVPIQAAFIPVAIAAVRLSLPSWTYLVAFLLLLLVYWSAYRTQVPLYLSSNQAWTALEALLPPPIPGRQLSFIDVGCGLGGVLIYLAKARPDGSFQGIELAPLPCFVSWLRTKLGGLANCQVKWGSFWQADLSRYDVVYAYLSPVPMLDLWQKVSREMRPGSLFISNTFDVPGHPPMHAVQVDDLHASTLYLWRI